VAVAAGVVPDSVDAEASLRDVLAAALYANRELARLTAELRKENERLRAENAEQAAELGKLRADLAVLQRMVFGRSSERSRPEPPGGAGDAVGGQGAGTGTGRKRDPGRGQGGEITRTCPGSRCSGIFPAAGTAARNAGSRSRRWTITGPGSSWTGR
jgi:transposase